MTKKKSKQSNRDHIEGDLNDPYSLGSLVRKWLSDLAVLNYSPKTINGRRLHLNRFTRWAHQRNLERVDQITKPILKRYARHLYYHVDAKGRRLGFPAQHNTLCILKGWFKWLCVEDYLPANPASELPMPRVGQRLPRQILTHAQVEQLLNTPNMNTPTGQRDRIIMEFFYATGIRRAELADLDIFDIHLGRHVVKVRAGKGNKDRVIPLNSRIIKWLEKYMYEVRDGFIFKADENALFLNQKGERFYPQRLSEMLLFYLKKSGVADKGGTHLLRHSMATGMLEGGADIRFIQAMLGHSEISTTQIYTQVSVKKLLEVVEKTHPAVGNADRQNGEAILQDKADLSDILDEDDESSDDASGASS